MMLAVYSLWWRELLRFLRRPNCSLSALALPVILFLGVDAIHVATFALVAGVTAVLALVAALDDPANEFVQSVHASPAPRTALVVSKALAGVTLAAINGIVLIVLALTFR